MSTRRRTPPPAGGAPPAGTPPVTPPTPPPAPAPTPPAATSWQAWVRRVVGIAVLLLTVGLMVRGCGNDTPAAAGTSTATQVAALEEAVALLKQQAAEIARLRAEVEALKRGQPTPPPTINPNPQPPIQPLPPPSVLPNRQPTVYTSNTVARIDSPEILTLKRQIVELEYKISASVADGLAGNNHPRVSSMRKADRALLEMDLANLKAALSQAEASVR